MSSMVVCALKPLHQDQTLLYKHFDYDLLYRAKFRSINSDVTLKDISLLANVSEVGRIYFFLTVATLLVYNCCSLLQM